MIQVFGFLLRTTFRNRFTRRIKRLREPRYLVPFVVSLLWFGNFVFRPFWGGSRHVRVVGLGMLPPDIREAFVFLGGLAIFIWIALLWILPDKKAALQFSPAELHFLFPAPITRRQLVQYKLLQAQIGILFGALISAFFAGARFTQLGGWGRLLALWLFFAIGHLHGIGASFVRTDLIEAGWSGVRRRAISIVVVLLFVLGVFLSAREAWTSVGGVVATWFGKDVEFNEKSIAALSSALAHAGSHGPASVLLWPFLALPRLLLATSTHDFLFYGAVGFALLGIHYLWVINTDTSFEEASLELSQKVADRREARKRTRRTGGILVKKAAPFPWKLKPRGRPETALVWKNVINLTRVTPVRALFALVAFNLAMVTWVIQLAQARDNLWLVVAGLSALIAGFTTVLGPVFLRNDLREDLFRIDSIKTMPLAGHAIVWGEVLGSWTALACIQFVMILLAAAGLFLSHADSVQGVTTPWLYFGGGAALIVLPAVTLAAVTLQNAMVVLLPAWVSLGNSRARGFEASGQRILTLFGSLFALSVVVLPAAASGGIVAWLLAAHIGPACMLVGAVIAAAWMWGEVVLACRMLGGLVDRLDPSTAGIEAQED
jgi:hypothetical protein